MSVEMAMANSDFIHGNWNPARSSSNNIFIKSGKGTKNAKVHSKVVRSHEYPPSNHGGGAIYANRDIIREANYQRYHQHHHQHHLHQNNDEARIYYDGNGGGIPNRYDFNNASIIYGSSSGSSLGTRYGYQYRSNPQISFSNSLGDTTVTTTGSSGAVDDFDTLSTTYDKSSCNPVRLAVSRNSNRNAQKRASGEHPSGGNGMSSGQQIVKWKNDFTAAASGLNRKWCDFVFRRNEDNRVYRSESFRFIQKTNSLSLLTPISPSGLQAQRNNRKRISLHGISVNDDYIDPVDHVLNLSPSAAPHNNNCNQLDSVREGAWSASGSTSGVSGDTSSGGSRKSGLTSDGGTSSTNFEGDDREGDDDKGEPPYHEIPERYNAPYYYSDTIKEPTYINPCENQVNDDDEPEDVQGSSGNASAGCSSLSNTCSPSPVLSDTLEPVTVTIVTTNTTESEETEQEILRRPDPGVRKQNKLNRRSAYLRGSSRELMARKRYETAFLPSSSPHASSSQTTPDIDSLLLAIESSCHLGQGQHGYVTKTDITSSTHPAKTGVSSSSFPNEESEVPPPPHQKYQQDGGADKHIIYISHSPSYATNNALSTNQMSTGEQQQQQYPISSCPSSVPPETTSATAAVITNSSNNSSQLPQNYHPHRSSITEASCSSTEIAGSNASLQTNPSTSSSYCQSHHHHHFQHHHHPHHLHHNLNINLMPTVVRTSGLCTTTNSSPLATHKLASKPIMPLSEPLPQKRYIGKGGISSSHHHTNTSSSSSSSSNSGGPGETRRLGHNLKDNSVSSLESIDSTKSEELSSSLNRHSTTNYHHYQHHNYQPQKLLSPISDKSPLEPLANSHGGSHHSSELDGNLEVEGIHQNRPKWSNTISLLDAAELTNVPWEMPKLRRKLAKLADSGISLDFAGSGSKETDCAAIAASGNCGGGSASGTGCAGGGHGTLDFSLGRSSNTHTYATTVPTTQHQGGGGSGVGSASGSQGQSKREMAASSLQLSFDDGGLTRDEYYEDPNYAVHDHHHGEMTLGYCGPASSSSTRQGFLTASKIPGSAIVEDVTSVQVHVPQQEQQQQPQGKHGSSARPDRCRMKLDFSSTRGLGGFGGGGGLGLSSLLLLPDPANVIDPNIELERQDWFHGAITRCEAESILRATKEGSFLVRNCESTTFNRYSLSLKSFRGCIHIRIEPNSLGTFSLGDQEFPSVPHLVLHFMSHRLPIKGAEHVRLMYPVITQLL